MDTREARAYLSCTQVNTVTANGDLSRAIIPHSLHMAVIGAVVTWRCTLRAIPSGLLHRLLGIREATDQLVRLDGLITPLG